MTSQIGSTRCDIERSSGYRSLNALAACLLLPLFPGPVMEDTQAICDFLLAYYQGPRAQPHPMRPTYASRLPRELWTMIWENLPFTDCLSLLAVCREWNELAMASPRLWTELCVASPPLVGEKADEGEDWDEDEDEDEDEAPPDELISADYVSLVPGIPPGSITDIALLTRLLSFTRELDLTIYLVLYGQVGRNFLDELAYVLQSHKPRILELHFFFVRPWLARTLLISLQPLETIRCLQLHSPYDAEYCDEADDNPRCDDSGWNVYNIRDVVDDHPATLRMLQSFKSSHAFSWNRLKHKFVNLTSLCMKAISYSSIEGALAACPRLEELRVHLNFWGIGHRSLPVPEMHQEALDTAARLRMVQFSQVDVSHGQWLHRVFSSATREDYALSYHYFPFLSLPACPNILNEIARPTHIEATFSPMRVRIECSDDSPPRCQQRLLSIPIRWVDYIWDLLRHVPTANTRFIRCPWLAWDPLSTLKSLQSLKS